MQFLRIEIGLDVVGFIVLIFLLLVWIVGLMTIGMAIERRWGR